MIKDSTNVIDPSIATPTNRTVETANKGISISIRSFVTDSLLANNAEKPTTRRIFAIFDPMAFAATISGAPCNMAEIPEISSGNEVPRPTITTPTTNGERPAAKPIFSEDPSRKSAPLTNTNNETTNTAIQNKIIYVYYI